MKYRSLLKERTKISREIERINILQRDVNKKKSFELSAQRDELKKKYIFYDKMIKRI